MELIAQLTAADGRLVSARDRPYGQGWLLRVEMPDEAAARWARALVTAAGLKLGGNDTGTQVTFTVPGSEFGELSGRLPLDPPP